MSQNKISTTLQALAKNPAKRSKIARLREVMPDVENALAAGVTIKTVLEGLNENGLSLTFASFKTMLYRLRLENGGKPKKTAVAELQQEPAQQKTKPNPIYRPPPPDIEETPQENEISTNPADLDKIIGSTPDLEALAKAARKRK